MRRVAQTKFGEHDGNCFEACLATILDLDLGDVPNFDGLQGPEDWGRMVLWLLDSSLAAIHLGAGIAERWTPQPHLRYAIGHCESSNPAFDHAVVVDLGSAVTLTKRPNKWRIAWDPDPHTPSDHNYSVNAMTYLIRVGTLK